MLVWWKCSVFWVLSPLWHECPNCIFSCFDLAVHLLLTRLMGQYCFALWRLLSSVGSVTLHGGPAGGFSHAGQAMTSCHHQSNYSSMVTLHSGPVWLHPVSAKPCFLLIPFHSFHWLSWFGYTKGIQLVKKPAVVSITWNSCYTLVHHEVVQEFQGAIHSVTWTWKQSVVCWPMTYWKHWLTCVCCCRRLLTVRCMLLSSSHCRIHLMKSKRPSAHSISGFLYSLTS